MEIVKAGVERVEELEPLWKALQQHHSQVMARPAGLTPRDLDESWGLRRRKYRSLLAEPGAFVLIAEDDGDPVGYAMVHLSDGSIGYTTSETVGDVETLSVMPSARGAGVGAALMDAVDSELAALGIREVRLGVVAGNDDAIRFYERRGMRPFAVTLIGKIAGC
jgi:GNAT superfamily N-acetyltransferase